MPRLFIALPLPAPVKTLFQDLSEPREGVRWIQASQMHLTLRFIGEVDEVTTKVLIDALGSVRAPAFGLHLHGLGLFPGRRRPRVLWVGAEAGALRPLQAAVVRAVAPWCPPAGEGPFRPHITLARLNRPDGAWLDAFLRRHASFDAGTVPVTAFHLYASTLLAAGAVHHRLAAFPLTPS